MTSKNLAVDWLLEQDQPSIRYLALRDLLGRPESDPEVRSASDRIGKAGWGKTILDSRVTGGYWVHDKSLYRPKYIATNWMLLVLSDLGFTRKDPRIARSCELWMKWTSARDGGFEASNKGNPKYGHLCITGNTARAMVKFGYADHPRVERAFQWLVKSQAPLGGWSCWNFGHRRRGRNLDSWEPMSAFAAYPRQKWTRGMKLAVEKGAEYYLERELHRQGDRYEPWYRFHYPVHYYYDLLVGLDFMSALGYGGDKRLRFALSLMKKKRKPDGRWVLDSVNPDPESPQGRWNREHPERATIPFSLEERGKPSKMVTLTALKVLDRVDSA